MTDSRQPNLFDDGRDEAVVPSCAVPPYHELGDRGDSAVGAGPSMGDDAPNAVPQAPLDCVADRRSTPAVPTHPLSPAASTRSFDEIVHYLRTAGGVRGHDACVSYLALVGSAAYRAHGPRVRILLSAPTASGKTFLLDAYAKAIGLPYLVMDASAISPEGWTGIGVSDTVASAYDRAGRDVTMLERGVVLVLDEFDKAVRAADADAMGTAVRRDRQAALLQLVWGGTPIDFSSRAAGAPPYDLRCRTDQWIVIAAGAFADADWAQAGRAPTDAELVSYGMLPELAARLTTRLTLPARGATEIARLMRASSDGIDAIAMVCSRYGLELEVTDGAIARVAAAVAAGEHGLTLRVGTQILVDAVNRVLVRALQERWPVGSAIQIAPDDLTFPVRRRR